MRVGLKRLGETGQESGCSLKRLTEGIPLGNQRFFTNCRISFSEI
jgi:hypothetical protein